MNPFQRLGKRISDWWHGNIQNGGIMSLNSSDFLDLMGLRRKGKPTSEVTYFTCLTAMIQKQMIDMEFIKCDNFVLHGEIAILNQRVQELEEKLC